MSPSEDVKFSNVRGIYLRKYGIQRECFKIPFYCTINKLFIIIIIKVNENCHIFLKDPYKLHNGPKFYMSSNEICTSDKSSAISGNVNTVARHLGPADSVDFSLISPITEMGVDTLEYFPQKLFVEIRNAFFF